MAATDTARSGRELAGFDFTGRMAQLARVVCAALPELAHVDMSRVAVAFAQTRQATCHGVQATLTPLRQAGGAIESTRRGRVWRIQQVVDARGVEMLYLLRFYVPRFLDQPLEEKLITLVHELWHISPAFDGDLRRHPGRCFAHSHSRQAYDVEMKRLVDRWLAASPDPAHFEFLGCTFRELAQRHGQVFGRRIPAPKLFAAEHPLHPIRLSTPALADAEAASPGAATESR